MKRKILLVEDNEMNQDMLSRYLTLFEFAVVVADSGVRGIEMAQSEAPDLILMDMSLPEMDGWEATRRLKNDHNTRSIPIIGLTAHAMSGDKEKALLAGCNDYLTKPIDFTSLLKKLDALLATEAA
jgi:two-component system, cell cycle response regulator DivK